MNIDDIVLNDENKKVNEALGTFLKSYINPAFGVLPKSEIDILVLDVLEKLGAINKDPKIYDLVSKLKITRTKAKNLIYSRDLRRYDEDILEHKVKELLKNPIIENNGEKILFEVENSLISDHIKNKIQKLNHISDGSFSSNIISLNSNAMSKLMLSYLSEEDIVKLDKVFDKAGAPDGKTTNDNLKHSYKMLSNKIVSKTGDILMDKATYFFSSILTGQIDNILGLIKTFWS